MRLIGHCGHCRISRLVCGGFSKMYFRKLFSHGNNLRKRTVFCIAIVFIFIILVSLLFANLFEDTSKYQVKEPLINKRSTSMHHLFSRVSDDFPSISLTKALSLRFLAPQGPLFTLLHPSFPDFGHTYPVTGCNGFLPALTHINRLALADSINKRFSFFFNPLYRAFRYPNSTFK